MKFLEVDGRYINIEKIISIHSQFSVVDGIKFTTIQCESQEYYTETPIDNILTKLAELTGNGG